MSAPALVVPPKSLVRLASPEKSFTPEEEELRFCGVGSSDIPFVVGSMSFDGKGAHTVYDEKSTKTSSFVGNFVSRAGQRLQSVVAHDYESKHPKHEVYCAEQVVFSGEEPWAFASPDYEVHVNGKPSHLLEIKTTKMKLAWKAGPPQYVVDQCLWQLWIRGFEMAKVGVWFRSSDNEPTYFDVGMDRKRLEWLVRQGRIFWFDYVQKGVRPPIPFPLEVYR